MTELTKSNEYGTEQIIYGKAQRGTRQSDRGFQKSGRTNPVSECQPCPTEQVAPL